MGSYMKKLGLLLALVLSAPTWAQNTYSKFAPANGVLKGSTTTYVTTAAADTDIISLWSGTCSSTTYLSGSGVCSTPAGTGGGTVNSVAQTVPQGLCISGSPVTNVGTLAITWCTGETDHQVLGTGTTGQVELITLTAADLPSIPTSQLTGTVAAANGGTGEAGTITGVVKANATSAYTAAVAADVYGLWSGTCNSTTFLRGDGACATPAAGSVTSVAMSWTGSGITIGGTPITSSGTFALSGTLNAATGGSGEAGTITGVLKGNATSAYTAAVAADVYGLWSGTCSSTTFLRGDGSCAAPSGVSGANPTATIGLTANNGSATTYMRSDASPALGQTISPVMTGNWEFIPSSGTGILIDSTAGNAGLHVIGASGSGAFVDYTDGSSGARAWLTGVGISVVGDYEIYDNTAVSSRLQISTGGGVTIPGSVTVGPTGGGLTVTTVGSGSFVSLANNGTSEGGLCLNTQASGAECIVGDIQNDLSIRFNSGNTFRIGNTAGSDFFDLSASAANFRGQNVNISAAGLGGTSLVVTGVNSAFTEQIVAGTGSGGSDGLQIFAGTNSSDFALRIVNAAQTLQTVGILGDGGVIIGGPTGGDKGAGTINMQGCFVNGVACSTTSGVAQTVTAETWTVSSGCTSAVSVPVEFIVTGSSITMTISPVTCTTTSGATAINITGTFPTGAVPSHTHQAPMTPTVSGVTPGIFYTISSSGLTFTPTSSFGTVTFGTCGPTGAYCDVTYNSTF